MPRVTAFLYGDSLSIVDSRTDRIDIPAGSGTVSLYLSTFDIFNADKICFAYRIEGINQDWIYLPQGVNTLYINNLTKGNHKLHLRSTDGSGCWKEGESVILLHRQSFWWMDNPYHCPHGRPTIISMTKYELEKKFKRIV